MKVFKSNLYLFTVLIIITSILQGCGTQQKSDNLYDSNDTTLGQPVSYGTIKIDPVKLNDTLTMLLKAYNCFESCPTCKYGVACPGSDVMCEELCKRYSDHSITTVTDVERPVVIIDDRTNYILHLTNDAIDLKFMFDQYSALSKNTSAKFKISEAKIDDLLRKLEFSYKVASAVNEVSGKQIIKK